MAARLTRGASPLGLPDTRSRALAGDAGQPVGGIAAKLRVFVLVAAVVVAACGDEESPNNPTDPPCATITIANNAVSPNAVTVSPGCRVLFVNNDTRDHDMASDPHPEHTDCREINSVSVLQPGRSGE